MIRSRTFCSEFLTAGSSLSMMPLKIQRGWKAAMKVADLPLGRKT
jgi:hypothetical protein